MGNSSKRKSKILFPIMESLERGVFGFYSARHARRDPAAKIALQNFINFNIMIK